jgi:hypothetical protein
MAGGNNSHPANPTGAELALGGSGNWTPTTGGYYGNNSALSPTLSLRGKRGSHLHISLSVESELAINYTQYTYDALGRLWKVTDADGHITTTRYYPDNKVWKVTDSENHNTVTNTYYGNGSLKQVKDAKNNVTQYTYNGFLAPDTTTYPDSSYEQSTYDSYRRLTQQRGRSGQTLNFTYDNYKRVVRGMGSHLHISHFPLTRSANPGTLMMLLACPATRCYWKNRSSTEGPMQNVTSVGMTP